MEINVAKTAGFCTGVNRAIALAYKETGKENVYTYGPLIHNKIVTDDLRKKGITIIEDLDRIVKGTVIIRSHGAGKAVYDKLNEKGIKIIDGTCPFVKAIHSYVQKYHNDGYEIIIIGSRDHAEVIGINGWCDNSALIIENVEEVLQNKLFFEKKYAIVVQTTFKIQKFYDIINEIKKYNLNFVIKNTICSATENRQKEAFELSKECDKMIVIGDKQSSNTNKLYEICKNNCENTIFVETISDLVLNNFGINDKIGLTAGASTPPVIIKEVIGTMNDLQNEVARNNEEGEELTFSQLLDQSLISLHTGDIVKGTVINVSNEEVSVNLGYKSDGIIPRGEFSSDPTVIPSQVVKSGDEIEVFVVRVNDGDGNVLLSKKRIEAQKGMEDIEKAFNEKTPVTGVVTDVVKGGIISIVNGVRVFIPSSQVSNKFVEDLNAFKGQELTFNIIELELDKGKRRIIGGRRDLLAKEQNEKRAKLFDNIEVSSKIKGKVSRLTDFGAFVDLGGVDGLIHISEMSWGRISKPSEVLSVGDEVEAIVLDVDKEKGKISLSLKDVNSNPWLTAAEKYAVGTVVKGKVVRMVPFGAFVELEPGVDGLIHISQIATKHIAKPEDELKIGQEVEAKVLEVTTENKKISLSIKALVEPAAAEEAPAEEVAEETTEE